METLSPPYVILNPVFVTLYIFSTPKLPDTLPSVLEKHATTFGGAENTFLKDIETSALELKSPLPQSTIGISPFKHENSRVLRGSFYIHKKRKEKKIMNKDKLILKDGTEIALEAGASLSALQVASADRASMLATWQQLTPANLAAVQIRNGAGLTAGTYTDLVLVSESSVVSTDGSVLTTYSLREKTPEERRLDALEEGQQVQDGAINDVAILAGTLAEQAGGTL